MTRRPTLHDVAIHDASHMEVARNLGAYNLTGVVYDERRGGRFDGEFDGTREEEAVILLAGGIGQRMLTGTRGEQADDLRQVRSLLRGSSMSMRDARKAAERQVRANEGAIRAGARRLLGRRGDA